MELNQIIPIVRNKPGSCYSQFIEHVETAPPENYGSPLVTSEEGRASNLRILKRSKMFLVDEEKSTLFQKTKNPKIDFSDLKMPFDEVFIEDICDVGTHLMQGILLYKKEKLTTQDKEWFKKIKAPTNLIKIQSIEVLKIDNKLNSTLAPFDFRLDLNTGKMWSIEKGHHDGEHFTKNEKDTYKFIKQYVINFLLFLNDPRVVTYIVSGNNKRREKKGLIPLPSMIMTKISSELKEYIHINHMSHSKFGYKFLVRGHWRILRSPRYGANAGKKIFINAHSRGEGLQAPQMWKVTDK